jgi:hypothetical protein
LNHFPDDVKSLLVKNTKERLEFLKQWVIEICWNLKKVNKWGDGFHQYYEEKGD